MHARSRVLINPLTAEGVYIYICIGPIQVLKVQSLMKYRQLLKNDLIGK